MIPVIYLLDQIPFKNYNVYVSDSSNLFDKASVKENQKKDWNDEHGYDIDLQSRYHNSKTITIDCFIYANSLKECIEKYNDFYNALDKKGSRRLSVIAGDLRMEYQVFRQDTAENKLNYDDANAVGTFKLKLIENMPVKRILRSYNQPFIEIFKDYIFEYFKNIEIGGRNLVLNSKNTKNVFNDTEIEKYIIYDISNGELEPNTEYILTWEYLTSGNFKPSMVFFVSDVYEHRYTSGIEATYNTWVKKEWKFITGSNPNQKGVIRFDHKGSSDGANCILSVRLVKLEKGNKATDWTPAPEDVEIDFLNQISSDNIISINDKVQLKNKINNYISEYKVLETNSLASFILKEKFNKMITYSNFILKNLNEDTVVNSRLVNITLKSKKVLVINWGDGTEQYTSPGTEIYSHTYLTTGIFYPMILGDLDSITTFNSNATILWNRF